MKTSLSISVVYSVILMALFNLMIFVSDASGQPPGRGGGGGGGGSTPAVQVVSLANQYADVWGISDKVNNKVDLVGQLGARSLGSARVPTCWTVQANGTVSSAALATLPMLGNTTPRAINNDGIIVGYAFDPLADDWLTVPLVWPSKNAVAPLELPVPDLFEPGVEDESADAYGISDNGIVVGTVTSIGSGGPVSLIAWKVGFVAESLQILDSMIVDTGTTVNPKISVTSDLVAYSWGGPDGVRAVRMQLAWDEAEQELYVVPGSWATLFDSNSAVLCVNDFGTVGGNWGQGGVTNAFGYAIDIDGQLLDIPTLPSFRSYGNMYHYRVGRIGGINNRQEMLTYQFGHNPSTGIMRPRDVLVDMVAGTATDTLTFHSSWKIGSALRINNDGWFTGRIVNVSNVEIPVVVIR